MKRDKNAPKDITARWRWDIRKRTQFQKERRAGRFLPFILCVLTPRKEQTEGCVHDTPGTLVVDTRGTVYAVGKNNDGHSSGLVRLPDAMLARVSALSPRPSFSQGRGQTEGKQLFTPEDLAAEGHALGKSRLMNSFLRFAGKHWKALGHRAQGR